MKTISLLLVITFTSIAGAQRPRDVSPEPKWFKELDRNGDGRISRREAGEHELFERADANRNGFVTQREAALLARREQAKATEPVPDRAVFPANAQAVTAKRQILKRIASVTGRSKRPPNVVLILADDLGYADTSLYGSRTIPTPHIDALAAAGVKFTDAYVTAASCSPSRAGLITGRYQQRFGFEFNTSGAAITHRLHRGLDPAAITLADVMKSAGYSTGAIGKWHLGTQPQFHPLVRGFDEFYGFLAGAHSFLPSEKDEPIFSTVMRGHDPLSEPEYLTDAIARETSRFIDDHAAEPFFVYVPFNAVHTPIEATKKYQDRFPNVTDETRRDYYAMTSALDDAIGRIVETVKKNGLGDKTLIIFLNDNGGPIYTGVQSNGPLKLGKLFLFEGGVRVPMVMTWPGVLSGGGVFRGTTSSLDLFPTVCAATGIVLPSSIPTDGRDLLPFLSGESDGSPHETLFWSNGPNKAVRHGNWKLVKSGDSTWLYDLSADIGESKNLKDSHPQQLEQLESLLKQWQEDMSAPAWPSKPQRRRITIDGGIYEQNI
jgi:arylsulfatase A-like enzyme